jgi:hypothetical protein
LQITRLNEILSAVIGFALRAVFCKVNFGGMGVDVGDGQKFSSFTVLLDEAIVTVLYQVLHTSLDSK